MKKSLYCGAAAKDITPKVEMLPNLRGLVFNQYGAIHDNLLVRVLALGDGENKALIVGFDLDKALDPEIHIEKISDKYAIPEENIIYYGIHTHTAPIVGMRPGEPPMNSVFSYGPEVVETTAQYAKIVEEGLYRAIDEALANMQPAKMGCAQGESYININRNYDYQVEDEDGSVNPWADFGANFEGSVDRTLFVARFDDMQGKPIGFFMNYPMHNVVMWMNRYADGKSLVSSDLGGTVSKYMEERYPGCVALWSSGAAGDLNPMFMHELHYPDPVTGKVQTYIMEKGDPGLLKVLSARHYADVKKVINKIDCSDSEVEISGKIDWSVTPGRTVVRKDGKIVEVITGDDAAPYKVRMQLLKIGDLALMGMGGELLSSLGLYIKEISPMKNTVIINHNSSFLNPGAGYILDDNLLNRPGGNAQRSPIIAGHLKDSFKKVVSGLFESLE